MELSLDALNNIVANVQQKIRHWQFGNKAQLAFLEDLYLLINDGIPANRAVEMMSMVTTGLTREVALNLTQKIAEGQPLADGMREWFAPNVVEIIRVGEAGGALAQTMKSAINTLNQSGVAMSAFFGAISYPLFVMVIACSITVYLNNKVFGLFRAIKPMEDWPSAGVRLVHVADVIQHRWWVVIVGVIAIFLFLRFMMANYTGGLRVQLDRIPPFSFYRRMSGARLLETMGLLVANGVVFRSAIKVMQYQANPYMLSHLVQMEHLLSTGKTNIADVLATGLIEQQDLMRLRIMAEVKGFEHGLIRMGIRGTEQATSTLKTVSKVVGGIFLIIDMLLIVMIIQGIYMTGMSLSG